MARYTTHKTTCSYCGVGCGVEVQKDHYGQLELTGDEDYPVNKGMLCSKGRTLHYTVQNKKDRLLHPQMRWSKGQPLQRVNWETALNRTAATFKSIIDKYGPDSVGFYVSGQLLTEEYYIVNKLIKGFIGSNNIDTNSRLCMSSAVVGYKLALGEDAVPVGYEDIELADTFFIIGANPAWCHPILFRRLEQHLEKNPNCKVIVADPRKTQSTSLATTHIQLKPGTDIYLLKAIGRVLVEKGAISLDFITKSTTGFEEYKTSVFEHTVEEVAAICDIPAEQIYETANAITDAKGFISMWTMGMNQSVVGVNKNLALLNLHLITGHIGKPGSGPLSLTGQPNAMGGREVGGLANMLAVHKEYTNPKHREEVGTFWGTDKISSNAGLTATEMMNAMIDGKLKALWIICTNPVVSWPSARLADEALKKCNFVVVQDISANSDTLQYADVILPAAGFMEKDGTMTNSERRISYLPKIVEAPGEALPDTEILRNFAHKMGFATSFDYKNTEDIYLEYAQMTKGTNLDISGLTYQILKDKRSVQWPYKEGAEEGKIRLFEDHIFYTNDKKAHILTSPSENLSTPTTPEFPFILTTGRIRDQWHTMTRTGKVEKLKQHIDKPFCEIHPDDALALGVKEGELIALKNERGEVRVPAQITDTIKKGVVFLPMHWGKKLLNDLVRANNLTSMLVDSRSKQPDFKFATVSVEKFIKPKQKILIVGAGAAAYRFVLNYREMNTTDDIEVFSNEPTPFYNRVLLPDYISKDKTWDNLLKYNETAGDQMQCVLHNNAEIVEINREAKTITDQNGNVHSYDTLVLATGSSSFRPPIIPKDKEGIFTLRSKKDADNIGSYTEGKDNVVVVGGGVLGIELADSLRKIGKKVTVLQRSSRLMERQLDELGAKILDLELKDKGIQIIYNDECTGFVGKDQVQQLKLRSGRNLPCDAVVFAIGTRPNIEIGIKAKLHCGRGIVVNDYFQTSDKNIFAIGEIAEHNKMLYGITATAEEQASFLVRFLNGDISTPYTGSTLMNILKVEGLDICSVGLTEIPNAAEGYEEIVFTDVNKRTYKKCIILQDKLVGTILIGNKEEFVEYRDLIRNKQELGEKRDKLLRSSGESKKVLGKLVCSCNSVGEGNIKEAFLGGCTEFNAICTQTGAGTGCGSCRPEVKAILETLEVEQLIPAE